MRLSRYLLATLREAPKDAEVTSYKLMARAGMVRQLAAGIYDLLPTGLRVIRHVERIVREEMNRAGALEVSLPVVQPAELWKESNRWDEYGKELLRFKDRHERDFVLGPTHEEVISDLVRRDVSSYRQLPLNFYQIHTKFRDEIRPRFGLMRGREFVMKDAYSFHASQASLDDEYDKMYAAYTRIFTRCGLEFRAVEADTGSIGGSASHEFMVLAESGEDEILFSDACDYAANVEKATFRRGEGPIGTLPVSGMAEVSTPNLRSIAEVSNFLGAAAQTMIKTLVFETSDGYVLACCTGDRDVGEAKLKNAVGAAWAKFAELTEVEKKFGVPVGFLGPVKFPGKLKIVVDRDVMRLQSGITGANRTDFHLQHVVPGRDFQADLVADLVTARAGDPCPRSNGTLSSARGIEVGHIFKLGTKYSEKLGVTFLDEQGKSAPMLMGCYGIGIGRTAAAAIEQNHDDKGIVWPTALAPFAAAVVPLDLRNDDLCTAAERIYQDILDAGIDVYIDDRSERPGVKLNDCELLGIPYRIVLGKRGFENGIAEITDRRTSTMQEVPLGDAAHYVRERTPNTTRSA